MFKANLGKELVIRVVNDVGILAEISRTVADRGIGIRSICSWVQGIEGVVHLVTDDNLRALDALLKKGFKVSESKVVTVELPHKPGMLRRMTEELKEANLDICYLYATALPDDEKCLLFFSCSDNDRAVVTLTKPSAKIVALRKVAARL